MTLLSHLRAAIGAVALTVSAGAATAAENNWKMHVVWVPAREEAQAFTRIAELASENSGGTLAIQVFPGGALGIKDADMLRILPRGTVIQAAGLYPGYLTRDKPEYSFTMPPGVASEPESLKAALPELTKIYGATYEEVGITLLGFVGHPVQKTYIMCKEPVRTLEDLKSKKVRVWEQFQVDTFAKLGISAQIIGQNELYVAMQTGVVDCAVYTVGSALSISLNEVAPYASYLFPYVLHPLNMIVSTSAFEALPEEARTALEEAAATVQEETFDAYLSGKADDVAEEKYKAAGGTVLEPFSAEDREAFTAAAREVWKAASEAGSETAQSNYENLSKIVK
ncbi:C4-dicarboxylate ABC transporter substrate-binding protein [Acuticoccus sediminis]|uniref:C4-dicarboxylate ABC transporter substrate-binding protein n=1 Tax=Acuticoccus sediminis TaxID=2184697 RepID=A0A8B2NT42_9HYPH|nr:TRAP transporter substrate-binding protein DctP [Acuticoccus sediminis]RAI02101.1 C4-dicarboxylate ABC transporter substrate-binding protein [Acuticoccus sediminis]